jgi:hypothetical protein
MNPDEAPFAEPASPAEAVAPEPVSPEEAVAGGSMSLKEAARELEMAIHDSRVAFDSIGLGHLDQAHTSVLTARAGVDAAETAIRAAIAEAKARGEEVD